MFQQVLVVFFPSGFFVELEQEMKLEIFDVSLKKDPQITLINPPKMKQNGRGVVSMLACDGGSKTH